MKQLFAVAFVLALAAHAVAEPVSGLMIGADYNMVSATDPYVSFSGSSVNPTNLQGFSDSTSYIYFPFGYGAYSERGYVELSTYALNMLLGYIAGVLTGHSTYEQYFQGDQNTIFDTRLESDKNMFFVDQDLARLVFSGAFIDKLPLLAGVQLGLGNRGIHPVSGSTGQGPGVVAFDDDSAVYAGLNLGVSLNLLGILVQGLASYDWYYLLHSGVGDGNTTTFEVHLLPFFGSDVGRGFVAKATYRLGSFDYLKDFATIKPTKYTYSMLTFGVGWVLRL